jgi:hypothetical protein
VCRRFSSAPAHCSKWLATKHLRLAAFSICHAERPICVSFVSFPFSYLPGFVQDPVGRGHVFGSDGQAVLRDGDVRVTRKPLDNLDWRAFRPVRERRSSQLMKRAWGDEFCLSSRDLWGMLRRQWGRGTLSVPILGLDHGENTGPYDGPERFWQAGPSVQDVGQVSRSSGVHCAALR